MAILEDVKRELVGIPQALRETLEKGSPEYEALVRETRWGEGPIYVVAAGSSWSSALACAYAFESLLGWPVVARPAAVFRTYGLSVLRPRSILLIMSSLESSDEFVDLARAARSRGATVLVLSDEAASASAKAADGVFLIRTGEERAIGLRTAICRQVAVTAIALTAARIFKRPEPETDVLKAELEKLPEHVEWVSTHLADAIRSLAGELNRLGDVRVVGGGFYHPTAWHAARLLDELAGLNSYGFEASEFRGSRFEPSGDRGVLFLSGTRCRLKSEIHQAAQRARKTGGKILSITDGNDRELIQVSAMAILVPLLTEIVGSTLTLALLEWVAYRAALERARSLSQPRSIETAGGRKEQGGTR